MTWLSVKNIDSIYGEVLAVNNCYDFIVGFCYKKDDKWFCENDNELLENVTHFILISELRNTLPKPKF